MRPKTIRFGIVGSGRIVEQFLKSAREHPDFQAVALYSRSLEKARDFSHRMAIPEIFTDLRAMAASPGIDAVYVASPNALHADQSILFMEHGKHVLCEKAIASNVRELESMTRTAAERGVLLMEAMKTTVHPNFLAMRDHLASIGTVRRYCATYCQYSSRYDDFRRGVVQNAFDPAMSTGALMDIGVYTIAPLVALFGSPRSVHGHSTLLSNGIDGQGTILFDYDDMEAHVHYSKITASTMASEIQGEDGTIRIPSINLMDRVEVEQRGGAILTINEASEHGDMFWELNEFIRCIHECKKESSLNSLGLSLEVMKVMEEVRRQTGIIFPADLV